MATGMIRHPLPTVPQPHDRPDSFSSQPNQDPKTVPFHGEELFSFPSSTSTPPSRDADANRRRSGHVRGQSRSSRQYAQPVQRTNSYPQYGVSDDNHERLQAQSEHMLRRKTPNGILNGAYDGTVTAQSGRPHATKHILLPTSERMGEHSMMPQQQPSIGPAPLQTHAHTFDQGYSNGNIQLDRLLNPAWKIADIQKPLWMSPQPPQLPQIDSMLNQLPPSNLIMPYQQIGHHPFAFMPGVLPPAFGPTASNDSGPFGPYWPNGTFVPYRPAALRDMRFYPHHNSGWTSNGMPLNLGMSHGWNRNSNHPYLDMSSLSLGQQSSFSRPQSGPVGPLYARQYASNNNRPYESSRPDNFAYKDMSYKQPLPSNNTAFESGLSSGQTTPTPLNYDPPSTPLSEYGPDSQNAQLRERVFSWAHSIYIDLLKHLHETKRRNHQSRHSGSQPAAGPHIYPRPPRQPSCDFSRPSRSRSNSQREFESRSHRVDNRLDTTPHSHSTRNLALSQQMLRPISHSAEMQSPGQTPGYASYESRSSGRHPLLRRTTNTLTPSYQSMVRLDADPTCDAKTAVDLLLEMCLESSWKWVDGMLLGGCLAYALGDYAKAKDWYGKILALDPAHVEAMSNLAATMLATQNKQDAEQYWSQAVKLRPSYFEAVEHLIGLMCGDHRGKDAVAVIEHVQKALRLPPGGFASSNDYRSETSGSSISESPSVAEPDRPVFDFDQDTDRASRDCSDVPGSDEPGFGSSGYSIAGEDNGRILQLIHAKGNMLYAMSDNIGAARAFEEAVMIGVGRQFDNVEGLIHHILAIVRQSTGSGASTDPVLLTPTQALETAKLCFPHQGELPGLENIARGGQARKAVISTTSNSLLSLAKIFQDGMASSSSKVAAFKSSFGVREILGLYYLSLSLQPSPSTANNVGILLASVQQIASQLANKTHQKQMYPGVTPGSGIHLALLYYNYGLHLDQKHAHLYTNYGSLLKDIGQLQWAISMYEQAVKCDPNFDIALANLANAVKDTGRVMDAIDYYRRAVKANPDFAEAVCGLANALNSVCGWQGRGGIVAKDGSYDRWHVNEDNMLVDSHRYNAQSSGWIKRVVDLVDKQLAEGEEWGRGIITPHFMNTILQFIPLAGGADIDSSDRQESLAMTLQAWSSRKCEGARVVRLVERIIKRVTWQWYQDKYVLQQERSTQSYKRPRLPSSISIPAAPTVLPFHTFTCPMSVRQVRHISQRNGLRISTSTLRAPWLPGTVYQPPPPPSPALRVGYLSSDFNNHPLAHLMQSVFGLHDARKVEAFCYATTASDNSVHRKQIEDESPHFYDVTSWSTEKLVKRILDDGIHILINLNGYTRGARNEVFAARPAPIQMSFMGFAGTLGAEWCDYLLADETAIPVSTLRPWRRNVDIEDQIEVEQSGVENEDWIYGENIIFCRDTFFCCDHRQSAPDVKERQLNWSEEQERRWKMRKEMFPTLADDAIIFGNFNQLYKIEPTTFRTWLRILAAVPKAVLWLLRFPDLGEQYLKQTAERWATAEVASRILFTDVAPKNLHISRARVCDLFLDTPECNAHTTAADVLWSGTPLLTLPRYKYKMCSRMAASILKGALPKGADGVRAAKDLIAENEEDYERKAILLGNNMSYDGHKSRGRLGELRKILYEARWTSALFDTKRWVRDLEEGYDIAWRRWVKGEGGDIWLKAKR